MSPRRALTCGALALLALASLLLRPEEAPRPSASAPKPGRAVPAAAGAPVPRDPRGWSPAPPVPKTPKPRPAKNPLDGLSRAIVANPSGGAAPYVLREKDANVFFTAKGMTLALAGSPAPGASPAERRGYALRWGLVGASEVEPRAEGTSDAKVHHFVGDKSRWKEDQTAFTSIVYDEVRPGVDLAVESRSKGVKYTLHAARGADLANPRFRYDGAHEVRVSPDGKSVEIVTEVGTVREDGLVCYQGAPGARRDVPARYVPVGPQEVGIELDGVDPEQPLTIDPVITWSTYHGGALSPQAEDYANGIAVTSGGEVFVVGYTYCVDFPATGAGLIPNLQGFFDGFLIKIRSSATIEWATYLGGASYDYAHAVAVDSAGDVYVTGYTSSSDFPTTPGAYDDVQSGYEAFVMKFRNGGTLLWSTFLGGSSSDYGRAIAVDGSGHVYVGGYTYSTNFPIVGGFSATMTASPDGFVAKLTPGGDDLVWSSFLGGNDQDQIEGIAIDSSESVFVAGYTYSTDFPTSGGVDATLGGTVDAFLTKIKPGGAGIEWSTYVGGSGSDYGYAVAVLDTSEDPVVVGATSSSDFPWTAGSWDITYNSTEGFATRILSNGAAKVYSTFLGGTNSDYITGAAAGPADSLYVTGYTYSTNFPTTLGAYRTASVVTSDAFVTRLNATGTLLDFSTYLGGSNSDFGKGIAFDGSGVVVAGYTSSANFPLPVPGTFVDSTLGGTTDGFAVRLSPSLNAVAWSSFVGGHNSRGDEWGYDVAVDPSNGDVIVTGYTTSLDFPGGVVGVLDSTLGGIQDVYVTRISTDASGIPSIVWWTYLGGSSFDSAFGATVDRLGFPYIVGNTQSTDFPLLNAVDVTIAGTEAFVTCLNPSGTLFYSTFLGGGNSDYARAVAVDSSFNAAITGYTYSTNFPLLHPFDSTASTAPDIFVTVLDVTGGAIWSSYLGGNGADFGHGVALDENQTVYVTGYTQSSDFVVPAVGPDPTYGGNSDSFVTAIGWTGTNPSIDWSRYLGGSDSDYGQAIAVDPAGGFLYAVGYTYSNNFPTPNGMDTTLSSSTDVTVTRLNPANGNLVWSTYLGGSSTDYGYGVKTDAAGNVYVTGYTYSADFPTKGAFDPTFNGVADVFVTKIYASGAALVWSSFLGGSDGDYGQGIAIDENSGAVYVTGSTVSTDFPALNALDSLLDGNQDAFIVRIDRADPDEPDFSPVGTGAFRMDGTTVIPVGGWSDQGSLIVKARLTDSDDETLQLQVEIQPVGTAFSGITVYTSPPFPSGSIAGVTVPFSAVPPAEYHLAARAVDATGRTSAWVGFGGNSDLTPTADRDVGNDVADPIVSIDTPTASPTYYTAASTIALSGTASDVPAGVTAVRWSSGAIVTPSFGPADGTDSWSVPSIPLAPGSNLITIQADDAAGNQGVTTITVFRDGTVPTISITPPASTVTGVDSFSLAGLAGDNLSLFNVSWFNNLGGSGFASTTGSPTSVTWNATITGLSPGLNTITMIARDSAGNENYAAIVLHYDTAPPMVSIATPASGLITTSATLPLMNGSASDNDQVQSVGWENLTNSTSGPTLGSPTSWNVPGGTINLVTGPNVIQVRATDRVGLQATSSITVYRDTLIPTVAITAPTSAATYTTGSASITLGGTAADPDNIGVQSVAWQREAPIGTFQNSGSGTLASPGAPSSTWNTAPILLDFGVNRFIVTATDRAGRVSVAAILDVTYSASAPALTVGNPASTPHVTNLSVFPISGTVSDDASVTSMSYTIGATTTPMTVPGLPSGAGAVVPWSVSITLSPGTNVVTLNALDGGSTTSVAVTLIYDPTPPAVKITGPTTADDYYTGIPILTLGGTASDNRSVTALSWSTTAAVVPNSGIIPLAASWTVPSITLLAGPQTITVTATDEAGTTSTDTLLVTYDPTQPTLTITSPTVGDTFITGTTPLITLAGVASDNALLESVTWTNAARNEGGSASGTTSWSVASIPLDPGANPITVIATDAAGNLRTDTLTVYYDDADPTVTITGPSPTTPFKTNAATILLEGTAADGVEVESVTWSNAATGVLGTATGTTSWSEPAVSLNPGDNAITVTVTDRVGRMSTDAITVHYDPNAPTIAVTTPAGAAPYRTPITPFVFVGTAGDMDGTPVSVGASQVTWTNTTTGGFGVAALVAGAWTASVPLTSGANSIGFTAEDAAGNLTTTSLVMTYDPAAPVVQIVTPTTDLTFTSAISPIVLGGTASDDVGIFQVTWSTDAAVIPAAGTATGTTDWTDSITLAPGSNVITVTAEDFVGRTGTARITIIYDPTPPTVAITVPTAEATFMTTNAPLSLAGAASDNLEVQSVTWENTTTGDLGIALGTGAWTIGSIPLIEGPNVITVTAVDSVGNSGMATLTVTYDATPPTVAITSPAIDPFPTTTRPLPLAGTAGDNLNLVSVTWANSLGGGGTATGTTNWTASVYLFPGSNVITVTATDAHSHTATDMITVDFTPESVAPTAVITTPSATGSAVSATQVVTVGGTADDNVAVVSVAWRNLATGVRGTAALSGGPSPVNWTADVPLTSGANIVAVTATDDAGNTVTVTITITYTSPSDAVVPAITITGPTLLDTYDSTVSPVALTITAIDNVGVASVSWANSATGGTGVATLVLGDTWTAPIALALGANILTVTARDAAGNEAIDILTVTFLPPPGDSSNPVVTILSHSTATTLSWASATIDLGGTASDNAGVATVVWSNGASGTSGSAEGTVTWTATVLLVPGINLVTMRTYDTSGNVDTDPITILYSPPPPPPEFAPAGHCGLTGLDGLALLALLGFLRRTRRP